MPRWGQIIIQCLLIIINFILLQEGIPHKWNVVLCGLQLLVSYIAQEYNVDGTPQRVSYEPNKPKIDNIGETKP